MGQLFATHVDIEESTAAINSIFAPQIGNIFGAEQKILSDVQNRGFNKEMEDLVNKFS